MKIKFWGVRGSIPSPRAGTVRYGGNTTCIEVRTDNNELIILDGGTGIFPLSQTLLKELPVTANIFITHSHWDHIHGLPFFIPNFIPGNKMILHGALDPVSGRGVEQVMGVQLQYSFFPVREAEMKASIEYISLAPGEKVQAGSATVTATMLNHPVVNFGYRIECNGKSLFFTGDHEPYANIYSPEDESYEEYSMLVEMQQRAVLDAMRGVDVLIADSSYTIEEYPSKKGWGHGTFDSCMSMADAVGAKILYCTHHEPTRDDDELEHVFAKALERHPRREGLADFRLAREGVEIEF
jgi:phosphoribosyl 1,2-cyclic phosphodiesterase